MYFEREISTVAGPWSNLVLAFYSTPRILLETGV
jgi:hypothetical protein